MPSPGGRQQPNHNNNHNYERTAGRSITTEDGRHDTSRSANGADGRSGHIENAKMHPVGDIGASGGGQGRGRGRRSNSGSDSHTEHASFESARSDDNQARRGSSTRNSTGGGGIGKRRADRLRKMIQGEGETRAE